MSDRPDLTPILKHLPGWRLDERYHAHQWCSVMRNDEGHEVRVELERGRLRFVGQWPTGQLPDKGGSITVKADQPAEQIVAAFSRRFLPGYVAQWAELKARADQEQEYKIDTETAWRKLAELPGMKASSNSKTLYGPAYTQLDVQGPDSIRLECRGNFTVKQIKRILKVLQ